MLNNDAEVVWWAGVSPHRYKVVTPIVEHPLRPGVWGYVALWPSGVYTLVAVNGHTHYTLPQAWAAAQTKVTPAPEVTP